MSDFSSDTPQLAALREALTAEGYLKPSYQYGHALLTRLNELDLGGEPELPGDPRPLPDQATLLQLPLAQTFIAAEKLLEDRHYQLPQTDPMRSASFHHDLVPAFEHTDPEMDRGRLDALGRLRFACLKLNLPEESIEGIGQILSDLQQRWDDKQPAADLDDAQLRTSTSGHGRDPFNGQFAMLTQGNAPSPRKLTDQSRPSQGGYGSNLSLLKSMGVLPFGKGA